MRYFRKVEESRTRLMLVLISILLFIYSVQIVFGFYRTDLKRKHLRVGDVCKFYLGEYKLRGLVLNINDEIEVWVLNRVFQIERNQIYP